MIVRPVCLEDSPELLGQTNGKGVSSVKKAAYIYIYVIIYIQIYIDLEDSRGSCRDVFLS